MGYFYYSGINVKAKNVSKAKKCFNKITLNGDRNDIFTLGLIYFEKKIDRKKGLKLLKISA